MLVRCVGGDYGATPDRCCVIEAFVLCVIIV